MGTRRKFILGTLGVAGALAIGWGVMPPRQRLTTAEPLPTGEGEVAFNGWVKIARDGTVTVTLAKSEMVQLDEERKAAMVSNLLVVLCSDRDAQPVVNTGTLYQ